MSRGNFIGDFKRRSFYTDYIIVDFKFRNKQIAATTQMLGENDFVWIGGRPDIFYLNTSNLQLRSNVGQGFACNMHGFYLSVKNIILEHGKK